MTTVSWSDDLSVGVEILDVDHRFLIKLINSFNDAVDSSAGEEDIAKILDALYEFTDFHFIREEVMMRACGYPEAEAHHDIHVNLTARMKDICDKYAANPSGALCEETREFLNGWLTKHIMGQDKQYVPSMEGKEVEIAKAHAPLLHHYSEAESGESTDVI